MSESSDSGSASPRSNPKAAARWYAWEWFKYHAGQRQAVFRFYLLIAGGLLAAFVASFNVHDPIKDYAFTVGAALVVVSVLFWRLDVRSAILVKLAEAYLKQEEKLLDRELMEAADVKAANERGEWDAAAIELATRADDRKGIRWHKWKLYSFKQVYGVIFLFIAAMGLAIFLSGFIPRLGQWARDFVMLACGATT